MQTYAELLRRGVCAPRPSALGPQNIARLNAILLFNFEVVFTLKL